MPEKQHKPKQHTDNRLVYRDADGRPHMVDEQEQAARNSQRQGDDAKPFVPGVSISPPD